MPLTQVNYDPFAPHTGKLTLVDHDPFATNAPPARGEGVLGYVKGNVGDAMKGAWDRLQGDAGAFAKDQAPDRAKSLGGSVDAERRLATLPLDAVALAASPVSGLIHAATEPVKKATGGVIDPEFALQAAGPEFGPVGAAGRAPELTENVAALERIRAKPSLAVATPSRGVRGMTNVIGQNSLVGPLVRGAVRRTIDAMHSKAAETTSRMGSGATASKAGEDIQEAVRRFTRTPSVLEQALARMNPGQREGLTRYARATPSRDKSLGFGGKSELLYDRASRLIGDEAQRIHLPSMRAALNDAMLQFDNPGLREHFTHSELARISSSLEGSHDTLSWGDAAGLRTKIREDLKADPSLRGKLSDAQVDRIYSALTDDLQSGAKRLGGDSAEKAWTEANKFYRAGMKRVNDTLQKVFDTGSGDAVTHDLIRSAQVGRGRNVDRLMQVRRSVTDDEWRDFSSTVLNQMGRITPGQATHESEFSFANFATNFAKLDQDGGAGLHALFDGAGRGQDLQDVRDLAHVAGQLKELHKLHNYSRSGEMIGNMAVGFVGWTHPQAAALGLMTGTAAAKALESPAFVRWLARLPHTGSLSDHLTEVRKMTEGEPELRPIYERLREAIIPASVVSQEVGGSRGAPQQSDQAQ